MNGVNGWMGGWSDDTTPWTGVWNSFDWSTRVNSLTHTKMRTTVAILIAISALTFAQFPSMQGGCPTFFSGPYSKPEELQKSHAYHMGIQQVEAAVSLGREIQNTPGISAGIVYQDQLVWSKGYGYGNQNKMEITKDTVFRIGSISKVFTTLCMMILRNRGVIHLDDEIVKYVPDFSMKIPFGNENSRGITFRQLSTHLAGLPSNIPFQDGPNVTNEMAFKWLKNMKLVLPTDTMPLYSNLGFAILGNVLAKAYGARTAEGYLDREHPCGTACWDDFGWSDPCGSFFSSVQDLSTLMSLFLSTNPISPQSGSVILPNFGPSDAREMMLTTYINSDKQSGFGMPFELYYIGKYLIRTKRGDVTGFASEIIMVPELKFGIIVLANEEEHAAALAQSMVNILIPAFESALFNLQPTVPLPPNYKDYVGDYSSPDLPGVVFRISTQGGGLYMQTFGAINDPEWPTLAQLKWLPNTMQFQWLPAPGDQESCLVIEIEQVLYQWIYFSGEPGNIQAFTMPSFTGYNTTFYKKQLCN